MHGTNSSSAQVKQSERFSEYPAQKDVLKENIPEVFYQQHIFAMCYLYQGQPFHIHYIYYLAKRYTVRQLYNESDFILTTIEVLPMKQCMPSM